VIAHLDARCENPYLRQFADNPLTRILRDRGRYIAAALTLCKAFRVSGEPPAARLASFEHWSDIVRSAIFWAGGGDAGRTIASIAADDPELECHAVVLAAWDKVFGSSVVTVTDLITAALQRDPLGRLTSPELNSALMAVAASKGGGLSNQRLGYWLRRHRDKILNHRAIRRSAAHRDSLSRWFLQ
jgi:putative DNA primase/helicase